MNLSHVTSQEILMQWGLKTIRQSYDNNSNSKALNFTIEVKIIVYIKSTVRKAKSQPLMYMRSPTR